eukprot:5599008-Amphidinium_carterae.1
MGVQTFGLFYKFLLARTLARITSPFPHSFLQYQSGHLWCQDAKQTLFALTALKTTTYSKKVGEGQ